MGIIQTIFIIASDVLLCVAGLLLIADATVQLVRSAVRSFRAPYPNNADRRFQTVLQDATAKTEHAMRTGIGN
jgi:hypothetical protein